MDIRTVKWMIDPVSLQMIRDVVTIFGVIAGLSYYVSNIRNRNKARQLQAISNVYNRGPTNFKFLEWELDDYEEIYSKYFDENDVESVSFRVSASFSPQMLSKTNSSASRLNTMFTA